MVERKLHHQASTQSIAVKATRLVTSTPNPELLIENLIDLVCQALRVNYAALARLDEKGMRHALSYAAQQISGVWSWVRDAEHVEVHDIEEERYAAEYFERPQPPGCRRRGKPAGKGRCHGRAG